MRLGVNLFSKSLFGVGIYGPATELLDVLLNIINWYLFQVHLVAPCKT